MVSTIKYPEMRAQLLDHLRCLSDIEYQRKYWVEGQRRSSQFHDELDYAVHFLFDDTCLAEDASREVGCILVSETEAEAVRGLVSQLERIFDKYGLKGRDTEYIESPEWKYVLAAANHASNIFEAGVRSGE